MSGIDKPQASDACSAAYAYDGRGPDWQPAESVQQPGSHDWHPRLIALASAGYIFLPQSYMPGGVLFRGMGSGLLEAMAAESFWHFPSTRPLARLERELDVIFCSEHAGDALAVAWPWESTSTDAGLLLFDSAGFSQRYLDHAAAVMALADPGMVFKYPLLATPLLWHDVVAIMVTPYVLQRCKAIISVEPASEQEEVLHTKLQRLAVNGLFDKLLVVSATDRAGWAEAVSGYLQRQRLSPARPTAVTDIPRRHA